MWKNLITYQLPSWKDLENNPVFITTEQAGTASLPSFVTFNYTNQTYTIYP